MEEIWRKIEYRIENRIMHVIHFSAAQKQIETQKKNVWTRVKKKIQTKTI